MTSPTPTPSTSTTTSLQSNGNKRVQASLCAISHHMARWPVVLTALIPGQPLSVVASFRFPTYTERLVCLEHVVCLYPPVHFFGRAGGVIMPAQPVSRVAVLFYNPEDFTDPSHAAHWAFEALWNHCDVWPESVCGALLEDHATPGMTGDDLADRHLQRLHLQSTMTIHSELQLTLLNDGARGGVLFRHPTEAEVTQYSLVASRITLPAPQRFFGVGQGAPPIPQRFVVWAAGELVAERVSRVVYGYSGLEPVTSSIYNVPYIMHWTPFITQRFHAATFPNLRMSPLHHLSVHLSLLFAQQVGNGGRG